MALKEMKNIQCVSDDPKEGIRFSTLREVSIFANLASHQSVINPEDQRFPIFKNVYFDLQRKTLTIATSLEKGGDLC